MSISALCARCDRRVEIANGDPEFCPVCSSPVVRDVAETRKADSQDLPREATA